MGCASWNDDPGREPGLDLPGAYGGGTNTPPGVGWLGDFNDPALNGLVVEALRNNPDVKATAARLRAALADVSIARADQLPQLDATLANSRTKRNNTGGFLTQARDVVEQFIEGKELVVYTEGPNEPRRSYSTDPRRRPVCASTPRRAACWAA